MSISIREQRRRLQVNVKTLRSMLSDVRELSGLREYELAVEQLDLLIKVATATRGICERLTKEDDR